MNIAIGPDPILEAVRTAMESRGLNPRSLAALTAPHDPTGRGISDTALRDWLSGKYRLSTERAGWAMAVLGIVPVATGRKEQVTHDE